MRHPANRPTAMASAHGDLGALAGAVKQALISSATRPKLADETDLMSPATESVTHRASKKFCRPAINAPPELGGFPPPFTPALLRPAMACAFLGISRTGLHRLSENDPTFPRKIVLSKRFVGYRAESLAAWLLGKESSL
jgi:prophage regulatory protein